MLYLATENNEVSSLKSFRLDLGLQVDHCCVIEKEKMPILMLEEHLLLHLSKIIVSYLEPLYI